MWKREHSDSQPILEFVLNYHSLDCIVVDTSYRDQGILQCALGFNPARQTEALMIHSYWRALDG